MAEGFTVRLVDSSGSPVTDPTGWTVTSEAPAAGTAAVPGSPIVLTLSQPAAAPAPAPAPGPLVKPGAFCPDADQGVVGHSSTGKTYTCGGHGPDTNGHLHWNTDYPPATAHANAVPLQVLRVLGVEQLRIH